MILKAPLRGLLGLVAVSTPGNEEAKKSRYSFAILLNFYRKQMLEIQNSRPYKRDSKRWYGNFAGNEEENKRAPVRSYSVQWWSWPLHVQVTPITSCQYGRYVMLGLGLDKAQFLCTTDFKEDLHGSNCPSSTTPILCRRPSRKWKEKVILSTENVVIKLEDLKIA